MKLVTGIASLLAFCIASCCLVRPMSAQVIRWQQNGVPICTASGWQKNPRTVADGSGGAIIAWEDIRSGVTPAIYSARITRDGATPWLKDGVLISEASNGQQLAGVVSDERGGAYIAWWNRKGGSYDVYAQRISATGSLLWTAGGIVVCDAAKDQQWVTIIADGKGGCILAWQDNRGASNDIYAQRLAPDGSASWTANGVAVCTAAGEQLYPDAAMDRQGGVYVVWMDRRSGDDIYAQRVYVDGMLAWSPEQAVCALPEKQIAPKIAPAGSDGATVVWQDYRGGASVSAIYMQLLAGDGNGRFLDGYQLAASPKSQSGLFITADGNGGAMATWTDFRNGQSDGDAYLGQMLSDGSIPKTSSQYGQPICAIAGSAQELAQLVGDSVGGAFVVWQDKRNTFDYDLYMNRLSATGQTNYSEWNQNGVLLTTADHDQLSPQVIGAGRGSAIVVWTDGRVADGQADIYAQKVDFAPWLSSTDTLSFGAKAVNSSSIDTLVIANTGPVPLKISDIRRPPVGNAYTDFRILTALTFPITLAPDSSIRLAVSFTPTNSGDRGTQIRINSNFSVDPVVIPLTGYGANPKIATLQMFIFGPARVGSVIDTMVENLIRSTGTGPLVITSLSMSGDHPDDFLLPDGLSLPITIPAQGAISLRLRFQPSGEGSRTALLNVRNSSTDSLKQITLRGAGGYPVFNNSPLKLHFDKTFVTRTQRKQLDIINTGGVDLNVISMRLEGARPDQFSIEPFTPLRIGTNAKSGFGVTFAPSEAGTFTATLLVESDDPASPHSISLDGVSEIINDVAERAVPSGFRVEQVYPSPLRTGDALHALVSFDHAVRGLGIEVVDILGRIVLRNNVGAVAQGRVVLTTSGAELSTLPRGVYRLRITEAGRMATSDTPLLLLR